MVFISMPSFAQTFTLSEAVNAARTNSVEAKEARQSFISAYWAYRIRRADCHRSIFTED